MEKCAYCDRNYPILKTGSKSENICTKCAEETHPPRKVKKTQKRNDLCNCGSGKKFKRCCL